MFSARQDHSAERDHVHPFNGVPYDNEGFLTDLSLRSNVVWPYVVKVVDLSLRHKLIDVDCACAIYRNRIEFFIRELDILALRNLVGLHDVLRPYLFARRFIDLPVANATAGFLIDLIEADLLALPGRRKKLNRTRKERQS